MQWTIVRGKFKTLTMLENVPKLLHIAGFRTQRLCILNILQFVNVSYRHSMVSCSCVQVAAEKSSEYTIRRGEVGLA